MPWRASRLSGSEKGEARHLRVDERGAALDAVRHQAAV